MGLDNFYIYVALISIAINLYRARNFKGERKNRGHKLRTGFGIQQSLTSAVTCWVVLVFLLSNQLLTLTINVTGSLHFLELNVPIGAQQPSASLGHRW